jgi:hypothetical protein
MNKINVSDRSSEMYSHPIDMNNMNSMVKIAVKWIVAQLVKKFPTFYFTRIAITVFTSAGL